MLTPWEVDRRLEQRALALKAGTLTPAHAAAEAEVDAGDHGEPDDPDEATQRRRRVQHQADPYLPEIPGGRLRGPGQGLPRPGRCGRAIRLPAVRPGKPGDVPPRAGHPGRGGLQPGSYDTSAAPVPIPRGTISAAGFSRPLLTEGQSRPCALGEPGC